MKLCDIESLSKYVVAAKAILEENSVFDYALEKERKLKTNDLSFYLMGEINLNSSFTSMTKISFRWSVIQVQRIKQYKLHERI